MAKYIECEALMEAVHKSRLHNPHKSGPARVAHETEHSHFLHLIGGVAYYIRDILLRMLTPRELYNAMGFPVDYIIDRDYTGKSYGKTLQVARCGNAVPPPFATALVRANLPELCNQEITTMADLERAVAV